MLRGKGGVDNNESLYVYDLFDEQKNFLLRKYLIKI